jgi:Domain of unknown function (DUF4224)
MTHPNLTDAEIAEICDPLKIGSAQCRFLERLGMVVKRKPNGKPLIARGEFERVMIGRQAETTVSGTQPNVVALMSLVNKRNNKGLKNGTQAQ